MSAFGHCEGCGTETVLLPLHGGKGGPLRCPFCVGKWNAEHGRKRRTGRVVIRAMKAFLDAGGRTSDIDKLKRAAQLDGSLFGGLLPPEVTDELNYMDGIARSDGGDIDMSSELLADVLRLTHPDHHPPEREELARSVTQRLLALQPFVLPAPKPKPEPIPPQGKTSRRQTPAEEKPKEQTPRFPCADCADAVPCEYCDACSAEHEKREREKDEKRRAKQRAQYARRGKMWTPPRDKSAVKSRTTRQDMVSVNQIQGVNLVNQKLSGLQAAILKTAITKRVPGARGCDVSNAELLAEIWGWEPSIELRWTKKTAHSDYNRAGDTRPLQDTHGAFNHIPPYQRRRAHASLSRALTRLAKRMLIEFVSGTMGTYSGGTVLAPHGEQIARQLVKADNRRPPDLSTGPKP